MFYVYVLKSAVDDSLYIGQTNNLEKRLEQHNAGQTTSNRRKLPYRLIYFEKADNRLEARTIEKKFKSGYMRESFRKLSSGKQSLGRGGGMADACVSKTHEG